MQTKFVDGKGTLQMLKADANAMMQAKYLLDFMTNNLPKEDPAWEAIRKASATLKNLTVRFGGRYLDDKGNMIETARRAKQNDEGPVGFNQPEQAPGEQSLMSIAQQRQEEQHSASNVGEQDAANS